MPRRRKELTPDIRARICELNSIGWKLTWIHKRYPHIPYTIIQSTIKQENTRKNQQTLPRSGRPKKISAEEQQHLLDLVEQDQLKYYKGGKIESCDYSQDPDHAKPNDCAIIARSDEFF